MIHLISKNTLNISIPKNIIQNLVEVDKSLYYSNPNKYKSHSTLLAVLLI